MLVRFLTFALVVYLVVTWLRSLWRAAYQDAVPRGRSAYRGGSAGEGPGTGPSAAIARCPFCGHTWGARPMPDRCEQCGTVFREGETRP